MTFPIDDATLRRYLDGELPFEDAEKVEQRLRSSPECARRLLELGKLYLERKDNSDGDQYGLPKHFGPFEVKRLLAVGGKGFVYHAFDPQADREVALKLLRPEAAEEYRSVARFRREAELAMSLTHPNIVRVYGAGQLMGRLYIAMEFVSGPNLQQFVRRRTRVSLKTTLIIATQVARALRAAHNVGIIHRDIKPSNVLIEQTGQVKVTDFGMARQVDDETSSISKVSKLIGSPVCVPPEQIRGKQPDIRSDVYGVGCLLFFMATGEFPFQGTRLEMVRGHLYYPPRAPSSVLADLPRWFDELVLKCLSKNVEERWENMEVLCRLFDKLRGKG